MYEHWRDVEETKRAKNRFEIRVLEFEIEEIRIDKCVTGTNQKTPDVQVWILAQKKREFELEERRIRTKIT